MEVDVYMKKWICIVCVLLALSLTACGGDVKTPDTPPEDVPENVPTYLDSENPSIENEHTHEPAGTAQTVEDPVSGYCGNTITRVQEWPEGEESSFWGSDSVTLTDIVINLEYDPDAICRCRPEYRVDTEFGSGYGVNLTHAYVRCDAGQASLTAEQVETIQDIILRNCA